MIKGGNNMKIRDNKIIWTSLLKAGGAIIALQTAFAPAVSMGAEESNDNILPEVIVSAQRRSENLQSTPLAITAVSAEELRSQNIESLMDIGALAPNVLVGGQSLTGANNGGFFIRGIGQERSGVDFDQGVGLYVDGVFMSRSDNTYLSIIDVERIEILRGPQGTLFGKNTIGGAINYITKQPGEEFEGYVDATVGSYNRMDVKASVNIPLSSSVFVKVTAGSLNRDGFLKHVVDDDREGGDNTQVGRLQIRALVSEAVTVDLSISKTRSKNSGRAFIVDFIDPNDFAIGRFRSKTGLPFDEQFVSPDNMTRRGGDNTSYDYDGINLSAIITADLSENLQLKSITAYMEADVVSANDWDGTEFSIYDIVNVRALDQFSQEIQLSGTAFEERLKFVSGLYYLKETPTDDGEVIAAFTSSFPGARQRNVDVEVESFAAFFQGTYDVTDALSVTAGLRYSKDDKKSASFQSAPLFNGVGEGSWDDVSSRIAVEYQWSDDVMTYASATKGYRSGGLNASFSNLVFTEYEPEIVWNYEAGIRADILDKRVRLNLTGFHMDYSQQQLTAFDAPTNTVFIHNVGTAKREGIELEVHAAPVGGLLLNGTFGYLNAKYTDVGTATGITIDSRVLRSPKYTFSIGGSYEVEVGEGSMVASLNYNNRSEQSTTSTDGNTVLLDSYGLLSGRLQYNAPDGQWSLSVFATNFLNKEYFIGGFDFARTEGFIGISQLDVGRPREIGVNLRYNF